MSEEEELKQHFTWLDSIKDGIEEARLFALEARSSSLQGGIDKLQESVRSLCGVISSLLEKVRALELERIQREKVLNYSASAPIEMLFKEPSYKSD